MSKEREYYQREIEMYYTKKTAVQQIISIAKIAVVIKLYQLINK